jgi:hypothetical protein
MKKKEIENQVEKDWNTNATFPICRKRHCVGTAMNENDVSSVDSVEKRPICGGELERGYFIGNRGLWWDTKEHTYLGGGDRLGKYRH